MSSHSAGVSLPGLSRTVFGTPSFPRSCSSPARRRSRSSAAPRPRTAPIPAAVSATRSEWREVKGDFASTTRPNASAIRSSRSSSARTTRSAGSSAATCMVTSGDATRSQKAASRATCSNRSASAGSNQVPRRRRTTSAAASGPPAAKKTSAVWASPTIRPSGAISSPRRPAGLPRPSQCSSADAIATTVASGNASRSRICAPRSQRSPTSSSPRRAPLRATAATLRRRRGRRPGGRADDVPHRLGRPVPVDPLQAALEVEVVAARGSATRGRRCSSSLRPSAEGRRRARSGRRRRGRARRRGACRSRRFGRRAPSAGPRSDRWRARAPR